MSQPPSQLAKARRHVTLQEASRNGRAFVLLREQRPGTLDHAAFAAQVSYELHKMSLGVARVKNRFERFSVFTWTS